MTEQLNEHTTMTSRVTVTTKRIADMYSWATAWRTDDLEDRPDLMQLRESNRAEFYRWLAAHDAEVRQVADAEIARLRDVIVRVEAAMRRHRAEGDYGLDRYISILGKAIVTADSIENGEPTIDVLKHMPHTVTRHEWITKSDDDTKGE